MTKIAIIKLLRATDVATIAFGGLMDPNAVAEARQKIIDDFTAQVRAYNKKHPDAGILIDVTPEKITAGTQTMYMPRLPKVGALIVKSHGYVVADVHCCFTDILPKTFAETDATWAFQTKAGNTIIISK